MLVTGRVPFGRSKQSVSGSFPLPEDWDLKHHDDCPAVRWGDDGIPWYTSWWFQPLWKILVKLDPFPTDRGWKYQKIFELPPSSIPWYDMNGRTFWTISGSRESWFLFVKFCELMCLHILLSGVTVYLPFRTFVSFSMQQSLTSGELNSSITSPKQTQEWKGFSPTFFLPKVTWFIWSAQVFLWTLFEVIMEFTLTKLFLFLFWKRRLSVESWGKSESVRGLRPSFDWVKGHDRCTICNPTFWEYTIYLHDIQSKVPSLTIIRKWEKKTFTALNQAVSALESTSLKTRQAAFSHPILYAPKTFSHDEFRAPTHTNWRHVVWIDARSIFRWCDGNHSWISWDLGK